MVAARSSMSDTDLVSDWLTPAQMGTTHPDATIAHVLSTTSTKANLAVDEKGPWSYDTLGTREINRVITVMNAVIAAEPENFPGVSNAYEFAQQALFDVIGMADSSWPSGGLGFGLTSTVDDLSRMGLLLLRKGNWDGMQLLEEDYVYRMTHPGFADTNPGYGYLTWLNSDAVVGTGAGVTSDASCTPYSVWSEYPHAPFFETLHDYGGSPFGQQAHDIGVAFAAGLGGQFTHVHRGLDLVVSGRNVSGPHSIWLAVMPALVALDPVYAGDEAGFCASYRRGFYAPTMLSSWDPNIGQVIRRIAQDRGPQALDCGTHGAAVSSLANGRGTCVVPPGQLLLTPQRCRELNGQFRRNGGVASCVSDEFVMSTDLTGNIQTGTSGTARWRANILVTNTTLFAVTDSQQGMVGARGTAASYVQSREVVLEEAAHEVASCQQGGLLSITWNDRPLDSPQCVAILEAYVDSLSD
jgi:hypothetical protein